MTKRLKIPKRVKKALEAVGNYRLHRGKRHIHVYVNGQLAGITPHCVSGDGQVHGNGEKNVIAKIKRLGNSNVL